MGRDILRRYVQELDLLPELTTALLALIDEDTTEESEGPNDRTNTLVVYYLALGGTDEAACRSYLEIWRLLIMFASRIDHVQDDDPRTVPLPEGASLAAEYNLMMAYYTLVLRLLDRLADNGVPLERLQRVRDVWSSFLLTAWSGQQRDLAYQRTTSDTVPSFEQYQETAQAKSGAFHALGLSGLCALASDNEEWREVSSQIGMTVGSMIQFRDDIIDHEQREATSLTLPDIFRASQPVGAPPVPLSVYGTYVWTLYSQHILALSTRLPHDAQVAVRSLIEQAGRRHDLVVASSAAD